MIDTFTPLLERALGSELFAGGAMLAALGLGVTVLHMLCDRAAGLVMRRLSVSVTLDSRSPAFRHLWLWIEAEGVLAHVRRLRTTALGAAGGEILGPAPGRHWFRRGGCLVALTRDIGKPAAGRAQAPETVELSLLFGGIGTVRAWIEEGAALAAAADREAPRLHVHASGWWQDAGPLPPRALGTVLADDDRIERLAADLSRFLGAREWYVARGVPWRRGYLLHGPPGTGKSSAIRALASELGLGVAMLDLARPSLTDDELREALFQAPRRAIVAMEDIDAVFSGREAGRGASFSGLLNAIDGIGAQEGRALVMTTNHPERLDPALVRPGRADLHVELGPIGGAAAALLYERFFPGEAGLARRFEQAIGDRRLSPADVQGWLLANAEDPDAAASAPA